MLNLNRLNLRGGRQRSQSLVEFALSLVLLVMLISGLLDLGRVYFVLMAMEDTVGEGALYLSQDPSCITATSTRSDSSICTDPNNAFYRMKNSGSGLLNFTDSNYLNTSPLPVPGSDTTVDKIWYRVCWPDDPSDPVNNCGGEPYDWGADVEATVYVQMTYNFQLLSPFIPQIAGVNPLPITVGATQTLVAAP